VVSADTGNSVVESSEANNSFTKSWSCLIIGPMYTVKFPDLVIQDVWKVSEITGDKIYYRIKNQGDKDITITTTSYLYKYPCATPCMPVATDPVLPLAAGASRVEKFASYNFIPGGGSLCSVTVKADPNGDLVEKDETNNNRNESCTGL